MRGREKDSQNIAGADKAEFSHRVFSPSAAKTEVKTRVEHHGRHYEHSKRCLVVASNEKVYRGSSNCRPKVTDATKTRRTLGNPEGGISVCEHKPRE